jgi:surfactin synthase thioesterase subunit
VPYALRTADRVEVLAVQYPGRQDRRRETPLTTIHALADHVHQALSLRPDLPLVLFGHSMGAVVAYEVARRREAAGRPAARLIVSGRRAPAALPDTARPLHTMDDAAIIDEIRRLDGSASAVLGDPDLMAAALPSLRADYRAIETYRADQDQTVSCPITALTGDDDPKTPVTAAADWSHRTTGAFDLQVLPGGHFYLIDQMPTVIDILDQHLTAATELPQYDIL